MSGMLERSEARVQGQLDLLPEICWYPRTSLHPCLPIYASFCLGSQGISSKELVVLMMCQLSLPLSVQSPTSEENGKENTRAPSTQHSVFPNH